MPCYQALVAATVALMACHAAPEPTVRVDLATQRRMLARKAVANLFFLQRHPALPPGLRAVMGHAHATWVALATTPDGLAPASTGVAAGLH